MKKRIGLLLFLAGTTGMLGGYVVFAVHESWRIGFVQGAAFLLMSALPGWLYVRFLRVKQAQVREDYVLAIHRLGVDHPRFLPKPPVASIYYDEWLTDGGREHLNDTNIYVDKLDAQYGRRRTTDERSACVGALLPIGAVSVVCALGWGSILLDPTFLTGLASPTAGDMVRFGFLGAYAFVVQMLLRRYLQQDLRPGTYTSALVRFVIVFILTFVIWSVWPSSPSGGLLALAFTVGFFPIVGMQWLRNVISVGLRHNVHSLRSPYPLSALDGLNVWYEAQLLEVGIEDMQNLVTANVVDIILDARVPIGRLVDWIDQAALLIHLPGTTKQGEPVERTLLRRAGVRCATDLEALFTADATADDMETFRTQMLSVLDGTQPRPSTVLTLLQVFRREPNLLLVRNWRHDWTISCHPVRSDATLRAVA